MKREELEAIYRNVFRSEQGKILFEDLAEVVGIYRINFGNDYTRRDLSIWVLLASKLICGAHILLYMLCS